MRDTVYSEDWLKERLARQAGMKGKEPSPAKVTERRAEASSLMATAPKAKNKYHNEKTEVDGIVFHSKGEAKRYGELKLLLKAGEIRDLECQVVFTLLTTPVQMSYVADFTYYEKRSKTVASHYWQYIVEDYKGARTREYIRKRKMMKVVHKIVIRET